MNMLQPDPFYDQLLIIYSQIRPASQPASARAVLFIFMTHIKLLLILICHHERGDMLHRGTAYVNYAD